MSDWRKRCDWCGWPLVTALEDGCTVDDCSMRPRPKLTEIGKLQRRVRRLECELRLCAIVMQQCEAVIHPLSNSDAIKVAWRLANGGE